MILCKATNVINPREATYNEGERCEIEMVFKVKRNSSNALAQTSLFFNQRLFILQLVDYVVVQA